MDIKKSKSFYIGAFWKVLSCFFFSLVNGMVRFVTAGNEINYLEEPIPFAQVAFFQNFIGAILLLPWVLRKSFSFKTTVLRLHFFRVLFASSGLVLWYASLSYMPITQALALSFTGPIMTVIVSKIYLKEPLSFFRIFSILFSILGAFLIIRPDKLFFKESIQETKWFYSLPLVSAICWVGSKVISRKIAQNGDSPHLMTLYLLIFVTPISFFPAFAIWESVSQIHFFWCVIIAITATMAHISMSYALSLAEVTFLIPFGFARLFLSGLIGYLVFDEIPNSAASWIGIFFILISLLILSYDQTKKQ